MSWNRKYRPQKIKDLHLSSVRNYFLKLMENGRFPQVFLFSGPKGTGKTSTARILGALLNDPSNAQQVDAVFVKKQASSAPFNEPSDTFSQYRAIFSGSSYLVQELDAASNRGIDDIRNLKERVLLPPVEGKVSVFILDEVHMLTTEAFNALLKVLEEPPSHVVFVLATTELQKIPETVASRCQVVTFTQATSQELLEAIKKVAEAEKVSIDDEALELIADQANGSFRDAIKLLEQAAQTGSTTLVQLKEILGSNYQKEIDSLLTAVLEKNSRLVTTLFEDLRQKGSNEVSFHKEVIKYLHSQLLIGLGVQTGTSVIPTDAARFLLSELSSSELSQPTPLPFLRLELKLLEVIDRASKKRLPAPPPGPPASDGTPPTASSATRKSPAVSKSALQKRPVATTQPPISATPITETLSEQQPENNQLNIDNLNGNGELLCQQWPSFVSQVAQKNFSLATLLKSAKAISGDIGEVTLNVYYKFHQEQLQQPRFMQLLNSLISESYGGPVKINCVLAESPADAELHEPTINEKLEKLAVDVLM